MSAARNALLSRPQWVITNQLTMPLMTIADNGKKSVRGLVTVAIPFTIFLDTLFADKVNILSTGRTMEKDQYQIFKSIEGALQTTGMNGKACLLRTICEMQRSDLKEYSLAGELATVLLTPKKGLFNDFLHDYLEAEHIGRAQNLSCSSAFPLCPVSLFKLFQMDNSASGNKAASHTDQEGEQGMHEVDTDSSWSSHAHSHWNKEGLGDGLSTEHPYVEENTI